MVLYKYYNGNYRPPLGSEKARVCHIIISFGSDVYSRPVCNVFGQSVPSCWSKRPYTTTLVTNRITALRRASYRNSWTDKCYITSPTLIAVQTTVASYHRQPQSCSQVFSPSLPSWLSRHLPLQTPSKPAPKLCKIGKSSAWPCLRHLAVPRATPGQLSLPTSPTPT